MNETLIAEFDDCLTAMEQGTDMEECLLRYPHLAVELRPRLQAAQKAQEYIAAVQPAPTFVEASRARFLSRAAELAAAQNAPQASNNGHAKAQTIHPPQPSVWGAFWAWLSLPLARRAVGVLALLIVVALAGAGMWRVSAQSLPGDALYGLKRAVEDTRLKLAPNSETRAQLEEEFDQQRLQEAQTVTGRGRSVALEFGGSLESIHGEFWFVNGIRILVPAGIEIKGTPQVGLDIFVRGITRPNGDVIAQEIRVAGEKFQGLLQQIRTGSWQIGDRTVWVNPNTQIIDRPQTGDRVEVNGLRLSDGGLLAKEIRLVKRAENNVDRTDPRPTQRPEDDRSGTLVATPIPGGDDHGGRTPEPTDTPSGDDHSGSPVATQTPAESSGKGKSDGSNSTAQVTRPAEPTKTSEPTKTPEPIKTQPPSRTSAPTKTPGSGGPSGGSGGGSGGSSGGSGHTTNTPGPGNR